MSGLFETGKKKLRNAFLVFSKEAMPVAFSWWLARASMSHSVVKCTLGRLRPRPSIRHAIDHLAKVTQRLTVLATLLGNSAALKYRPLRPEMVESLSLSIHGQQDMRIPSFARVPRRLLPGRAAAHF
jgi:hypothetical protein